MDFFTWAAQQNMTLADIADRLGYSERQVYRLRDGDTRQHRSFQARAIAEFGDAVRPLFLDSASVVTDNSSERAAK